jgi:hypothetical protein
LKELLIIQLDEAYFLFETFQMLNRYREALADFNLTILVNPQSLKAIQDGSCPIPQNVTTDADSVLNLSFDLSINLSLNDLSWNIHNLIKSDNKTGCFVSDSQLHVPDVWSSYLLTLKARAPFLTFHMQDIYKNVMGIKRFSPLTKLKPTFQQIAFSLSNTSFFSASEQEKLINLIHDHHPFLKICDISEIDPVSDLSKILYIGPASFDALKICENGAKGIFLSSQFQGFNLLPGNDGHYFVSAKNSHLFAEHLIKLIDCSILKLTLPDHLPFALYQTDGENLFGSYLRSLNLSDDVYPIYQSHVVLWNFILNLFDTNLEITKCTQDQVDLLESQKVVLQKLIRLYDYAMSSIDTIHQQANSKTINSEILHGHMNNLQEIEVISDKISQTHPFIRPILDFYRIRRGQNTGKILAEQSQHTFLTYSEEHQALKALLELFTVTLSKNEVSI